MSAIANAAHAVANLAQLRSEWTGEGAEDSLNAAAQAFINTGRDAHFRQGAYRGETASETLEDALFHASVARDILDGDIERPSVGNVRAYALSLM